MQEMNGYFVFPPANCRVNYPLLKMAVLIIIFALALVTLSDASCPSESHVNGCSVPLGMPFPFKPLFTPVCNRHDICYVCVCI